MNIQTGGVQASGIVSNPQYVLVGSKHKGKYVSKEKIIYIKASECYTWLYLLDGSKVLSSKPIGYYEKKLSIDRFVRIHRSFLINISHLKLYEQKYRLVHLKGEITLPVSYRRKNIFSKYLKSA